VLNGATPDRIPWATRLDNWYRSHKRSGTLPKELSELEEMEVHDALHIGRQSYVSLTKTLLEGVEMRVSFNGEEVFRKHNPVLSFPTDYGLVPLDNPGQTIVEFDTPAGTVSVVFKTTDEILEDFSVPYVEKHLIRQESDFQIVYWILDHCRTIADFDCFVSREEEIGQQGLTVGEIGRVPFQRLILDFLGEERCFYLMFDNPKQFRVLLDRLMELDVENLDMGLEFPGLMLEYGDNFDGEITNPNLFKEYCLLHLQQASEKAHAAGKVIGSHMDGDMSHLVELVPETGLDVIEAFSPYPLSGLTFHEAWPAWKNKIVMWGVIPSPLFEANTPEEEFERIVIDIVKTIAGQGKAILGVADQALPPTLPDRIVRAGEIIEEFGRY